MLKVATPRPSERCLHAVVWAAEHFHPYVYGTRFAIITDHKPLIGIFSIITSKLQLEMKGGNLFYDCNLIYRPGKDTGNDADFMSRHPSPSDVEPSNLTGDYVHFVCSNAVPKAMTLEELKQKAKKKMQKCEP